MTVTTSLASDVGVVRLLITDTNAQDAIFQDEELAAFLSLEGDSIKLAAAQALDTIATNEALTQKCIRVLDLSTDGAKLADALRKHAAELRQQAGDDLAASEAGTDFDVAEWVLDPASERERLINQALRGSI